jgi:hypothetical protein
MKSSLESGEAWTNGCGGRSFDASFRAAAMFVVYSGLLQTECCRTGR